MAVLGRTTQEMVVVETVARLKEWIAVVIHGASWALMLLYLSR